MSPLTESWTGGSILQHTVESGPEPHHSGHAGDLFRLLHGSQRQRDNREAQGKFVFLSNTESQVAVFDTTIINLVSVFLLFISECPVGPVHKISPHEQDKTTAAHSGQKWLPAASRVSLRVQGSAPPHTAEDDASQSRERHSQ